MRTVMAAGIGLAVGLGSLAIAQEPAKKQDAMKEPPGCELRAAMRKLWEDHIGYTRNFIIIALADGPDVDAVSKRLLRNQDEIGAAIKPYYGDEAGTKLAALLKDHILIAVDVVKAAKAGQKTELDAQQKKWSQNGDRKSVV